MSDPIEHPATGNSPVADSPPTQLSPSPSPPTPPVMFVRPTAPHDVPPSRPYTATGAASARTSFTRVDMESYVPSFPGSAPLSDEPSETGETEMEQAPTEPEPEETVPQMPQTSLTFLMITGRRRTMSFEPETTIGRVKELVWNAWPSEWQDERPPAPSYLRILYLGKILQDEDTLARLNFPSSLPSASSQTPATIVHLSIRPYAPPSDDEGFKKKRRRRRSARSEGGGAGEDDNTAGCCAGCVVC